MRPNYSTKTAYFLSSTIPNTCHVSNDVSIIPSFATVVADFVAVPLAAPQRCHGRAAIGAVDQVDDRDRGIDEQSKEERYLHLYKFREVV